MGCGQSCISYQSPLYRGRANILWIVLVLVCDVQVGILISLEGLNPRLFEGSILELHSVGMLTNTVIIP